MVEGLGGGVDRQQFPPDGSEQGSECLHGTGVAFDAAEGARKARRRPRPVGETPNRMDAGDRGAGRGRCVEDGCGQGPAAVKNNVARLEQTASGKNLVDLTDGVVGGGNQVESGGLHLVDAADRPPPADEFRRRFRTPLRSVDNVADLEHGSDAPEPGEDRPEVAAADDVESLHRCPVRVGTMPVSMFSL